MTVNRAMIAEKVAGLRADQEKLLPPWRELQSKPRQRPRRRVRRSSPPRRIIGS